MHSSNAEKTVPLTSCNSWRGFSGLGWETESIVTERGWYSTFYFRGVENNLNLLPNKQHH